MNSLTTMLLTLSVSPFFFPIFKPPSDLYKIHKPIPLYPPYIPPAQTNSQSSSTSQSNSASNSSNSAQNNQNSDYIRVLDELKKVKDSVNKLNSSVSSYNGDKYPVYLLNSTKNLEDKLHSTRSLLKLIPKHIDRSEAYSVIFETNNMLDLIHNVLMSRYPLNTTNLRDDDDILFGPPGGSYIELTSNRK